LFERDTGGAQRMADLIELANPADRRADGPAAAQGSGGSGE
jgi:hypothetical protein